MDCDCSDNPQYIYIYTCIYIYTHRYIDNMSRIVETHITQQPSIIYPFIATYIIIVSWFKAIFNDKLMIDRQGCLAALQLS